MRHTRSLKYSKLAFWASGAAAAPRKGTAARASASDGAEAGTVTFYFSLYSRVYLEKDRGSASPRTLEQPKRKQILAAEL